jgi:hypothetical protein
VARAAERSRTLEDVDAGREGEEWLIFLDDDNDTAFEERSAGVARVDAQEGPETSIRSRDIF